MGLSCTRPFRLPAAAARSIAVDAATIAKRAQALIKPRTTTWNPSDTRAEEKGARTAQRQHDRGTEAYATSGLSAVYNVMAAGFRLEESGGAVRIQKQNEDPAQRRHTPAHAIIPCSPPAPPPATPPGLPYTVATAGTEHGMYDCTCPLDKRIA